MKTIEKTCKTCNKIFNADMREHKRGNAIYCSLSCVRKQTKSLDYKMICKHCGKSYNSASKNSKYCSTSCKQKNYRLKSKGSNNIDIKTFYKVFKDIGCEICNWNETSYNLHHIIEVSNGGTNTLDNLINLCPNHHRMIHKNLISKDDIINIIENRTISSP